MLHPIFMISAMIVFDTVNFTLKRRPFSVLPLMGFKFLNLLRLLQCLVMTPTSMPVIKYLLLDISYRVIGIITFSKFDSRHYELVLNSKSD